MSTMSATMSGVRRRASVATQISCTLRLPAISSSRTAWRPSTCSPPSVLLRLARSARRVGVTRPVRPAPRDANCRDAVRAGAPRPLPTWRCAARGAGAGAARPSPTARGAAPFGAAAATAPLRPLPARRRTLRSPPAPLAGSCLPSVTAPCDDHGDRPAGDALAAAERAEALGPAALDGHRRAGARRSGCASISARCGASFGASQTTEQSTLPIVQPAAAHHAGDWREQHERVGARPLRVGVGEVLADVAEPGGAEQRVGDGVGDDVGVAVADAARARRRRRRRRAPAAASGSSLKRWTSKPWPTRTGSSAAPRATDSRVPTRGRRDR